VARGQSKRRRKWTERKGAGDGERVGPQEGQERAGVCEIAEQRVHVADGVERPWQMNFRFLLSSGFVRAGTRHCGRHTAFARFSPRHVRLHAQPAANHPVPNSRESSVLFGRVVRSLDVGGS